TKAKHPSPAEPLSLVSSSPSPPAAAVPLSPKPYSVEDLDLLYGALVNDGPKTFAGLIASSRQPGSWVGDGIWPGILRRMLDDCMRARLIWPTRRGLKDYFGLTRLGEERGATGEWPDVLGMKDAA